MLVKSFCTLTFETANLNFRKLVFFHDRGTVPANIYKRFWAIDLIFSADGCYIYIFRMSDLLFDQPKQIMNGKNYFWALSFLVTMAT